MVSRSLELSVHTHDEVHNGENSHPKIISNADGHADANVVSAVDPEAC